MKANGKSKAMVGDCSDATHVVVGDGGRVPAGSGAKSDGFSASRLYWLLPLLLLVLVGTLVVRARQSSRPPVEGEHNRVPLTMGPWGNLELVPMVIEPPDEFIFISQQMSHAEGWVFTGYSANSLADLFNTSELSPATRGWLMNTQNWQIAAGQILIRPPPAVVMDLGGQARRKIYQALALCGGNPLQENPLSFRANSDADWFGAAGLSKATIATAKALLYPRGNALCLSDWPLVLKLLESQEERRRFLEVTGRQTTVLLRLKLGQRSNVDKLVDYWGRGGRNKDIRPLLQSLTQVTGGVALDVVHLLPRFARSRIYNYPYPVEKDSRSVTPNCFWSAMNFFNDRPEDELADPSQMRARLERDYFAVEEPSRLGDVILLSRPNGTLVHAAVFIAADVVWTKNGATHTQPWLLARMEDLAASYPSDTPLAMRAYRRKDL